MDEELLGVIRDNNLLRFRELLDRGANINYQGRYGSTPLILATLKNNLTMATELLDRGADPNQQDKNGQSVLTLGIYSNRPEIIKELLDRGANPNHQDKYGATPLMMALDRDDLEIIKELLNYGANPTLKDKNGRSAIDIARARDKEEILSLFQKFRVNPLIIDPETGISNLHILAARGPFYQLRSMIDLYPDLDIDLNQQDREGNTPLIFAINGRKPEHVAFLLDRGADPNLANNGGGTPLDYAAGQPEIEQMLLDAGAQ